MNVVPTARTRALAAALVAEAQATTGADAVLNHLDHLEEVADQGAALIAIILSAFPRGPSGRPMVALHYTAEQRRRGHALWAAGDRTPEVVARNREYQRVWARRRRGA